ncbi:MAG: polyketide synthase [Polyangiaceae bacterium]
MKNNNNEKIAIIGMGCRFPGGANDPETFWSNLKSGKDCITEIPPNRYGTNTVYSSFKDKPGKTITKWGGYIDGFDEFDPAFFGITPREARYMDPQQRKLLEVTWEALEDAAQKPKELAGKDVGVFIGGFTVDYKILQFGGSNFDRLAAHTSTGVMMTMLSNRISYIFDFRGPSMTIDTACSSSLTALHAACQSIKEGGCPMAIAGGVLLQSASQYTIAESKGGFLSPTGFSHPFDDSANGYVRSEGVGVVVLKKLSDALRDGDRIHAVIIGTGVNQDGHTNGITVPNPDAQITLIERVCEEAGIRPGELQYVEAHGTGTPVGDPIEANVLGEVLGRGRKPNTKCYIGSVKSNLGHAESAAGMAGLIKTVMCLKNRQIAPHLHLKRLNPKIEISKWPYEIPTELLAWPEHEGPARAGVNSFGFGGSNAHAILEEAPAVGGQRRATQVGRTKPKLITLTAKDSESLIDLASVYRRQGPRFKPGGRRVYAGS